jgi:hypothetical protein
MSIALYDITVPIFTRQLKGVAIVLKKAQAHYAAKKYDETSLLNQRMFPDMFNFARQIQATTDHARNCCASLAGVESPKMEMNEKSLAELIARVEKTIAFLDTLKPEQINGREDADITIQVMGKDTVFKGMALFQNRALPNFYFHSTTAYDMLRGNGLEIGKGNFMGRE